MAQIVAQSSNIGTIEIGQRLGPQGIFAGIRNLGYGSRTALGFPNEAAGTVLDPARWSGTSIATIPIGQGISATPMQVLEAYNTVANRGLYVAPRLLDSTVDPLGHEHPVPSDQGHRVMSTTTADEMNLMLRGVVTGGTGTLAAVDGYTVFGKTGTAREPQPTGGYTDKNGAYHYDATFVGVVPAESPALSVMVVIEDPSGANYYGGAIAAPAFSKIASYGLRLFHIPPPSTDAASGGTPVKGAVVGGVGGTVVTEPGGRIQGVPAGSQTASAPPAAGAAGSAGHSTGTTVVHGPAPPTTAPAAARKP